jgi:hypothetical protein
VKQLFGAAGSVQYVELILQYDRESWRRVLFERPNRGSWYLRSFMRPEEIIAARTIRGRLGPGLVPVAYDHYGNYVCINTSSRPGNVEFWDHETEKTETLARDLRTFIENLGQPPSMKAWDLGNPAFGAIREGDAEALASYLNSGGDPNAIQSGGFPTLAETAAMQGEVEMLERLHAKGASLRRTLRAAAKKRPSGRRRVPARAISRGHGRGSRRGDTTHRRRDLGASGDRRCSLDRRSRSERRREEGMRSGCGTQALPGARGQDRSCIRATHSMTARPGASRPRQQSLEVFGQAA